MPGWVAPVNEEKSVSDGELDQVSIPFLTTFAAPSAKGLFKHERTR
jgi:hypothetical protein